MVFPAKNAFPTENAFSCRKMNFRTAKCTFLKKSAFFSLQKHLLSRKCGSRGGTSQETTGNCTGLQRSRIKSASQLSQDPPLILLLTLLLILSECSLCALICSTSSSYTSINYPFSYSLTSSFFYLSSSSAFLFFCFSSTHLLLLLLLLLHNVLLVLSHFLLHNLPSLLLFFYFSFLIPNWG